MPASSAKNTDLVRIDLVPRGCVLEVERGVQLKEVLLDEGVEFPCGGKGRCSRCRIRVLKGNLPITPLDAQIFSTAELHAGWRLGCQAHASTDLTIELAQWEPQILSDDARFEFNPEDGLGVAVDLGTTTIVGQLLDLRTGNVLAVRSALNQQARYGADIMSRIEHAKTPAGLAALSTLIRKQIGQLVAELAVTALLPDTGNASPGTCHLLRRVVIVGNTAMHHLFCHIDVDPLSHYPFEPADAGLKCFTAQQLGWAVPGDPTVMFMPCVAGFVGSDTLAGVMATGLHKSEQLAGLIDLGTNGEIVIGKKGRLLCTSTAAGPAFEGAKISMGMLAATGAIAAVSAVNNRFHCTVLGGVTPRGICGSGLVDAVAAALDLGLVDSSGRLRGSNQLQLDGPVFLTQKDIREVQLAKAAIAAGFRLLLERWGVSGPELERVWLAGAFGNYINRISARRIGLIPFPVDKVLPAGNTALRGAKHFLLNWSRELENLMALKQQIEHICLNEEPRFHEVFVGEMSFPPTEAFTS
ncbi:MAG: ASKHA domain-containing protein [Verrucomicrobiae bacterium]|nr:ASKHA domain-containing protein [Verrucomicrobiae bacterium]